MTVRYFLQGIHFEWDPKKATANRRKHGVAFDAPPVRSGGFMKASDLKKRLRKDRPMITISLRIPEDVVEDLKRIAPRLGFSGYQPLLRAYVGQGLRRDLERLEGGIELSEFIDSLTRHGVDESVIAEAMAELDRR